MPDIAAFKPVIAAVLLPPGGLLLLLALAWVARRRHPRAAGVLAVAALTGLWLSQCVGTARWMQDSLLRPPPALTPRQVDELASVADGPPTAIVVLGSGRENSAEEYGRGMLSPAGLGRLTYGLWLARRSGWPVAYAGGIGWAEQGKVSEAEIAERIAADQGGPVPRWLDGLSRDTAENARNILPMLQASGIRRIVLVTHASHMPRALRWFRSAAGDAGPAIVPAPTGFIDTSDDSAAMAWLPSARGAFLVQTALHEVGGALLTARLQSTATASPPSEPKLDAR